MDAADPATECFVPVIRKWQTLYSLSGHLPSSREFQPDHLKEFPSRISVIEPVRGGEDFRYVIYAAAVVHAGGVDMTGYHVSDFFDEKLRTAVTKNLRAVLSDEEPRIWRYRHNWKDRSYDYCSLYIPLVHGAEKRFRIHSIIVNTDPTRRQLYSGRFEHTRMAVKPDQFRET